MYEICEGIPLVDISVLKNGLYQLRYISPLIESKRLILLKTADWEKFIKDPGVHLGRVLELMKNNSARMKIISVNIEKNLHSIKWEIREVKCWQEVPTASELEIYEKEAYKIIKDMHQDKKWIFQNISMKDIPIPFDDLEDAVYDIVSVDRAPAKMSGYFVMSVAVTGTDNVIKIINPRCSNFYTMRKAMTRQRHIVKRFSLKNNYLNRDPSDAWEFI